MYVYIYFILLLFRHFGIQLPSHDFYMQNYVSIGVDALVTYNFHKARESPFYLISSRIINKLIYFRWVVLMYICMFYSLFIWKKILLWWYIYFSEYSFLIYQDILAKDFWIGCTFLFYGFCAGYQHKSQKKETRNLFKSLYSLS